VRTEKEGTHGGINARWVAELSGAGQICADLIGVTVSISAVKDAAYYESYAQRGGPAPRWLGSAVASELGIHREVRVGEPVDDGELRRGGDLTRLLEGKHPDTGESLWPKKVRADHVAGFDITFSPPKSVSVLALLGGDQELADKLWQAHRDAVDATCAWMERELFVSRRGYAGRDGLMHGTVAAIGFDHATSREDDPQMHTHVVLANVHWGEDGRIGSLDTNTFWNGKRSRERIVKALGAVYEAELRKRVTEQTGLAWTKPLGKDRHREIAGVSQKVLKAFSRRRSQIEDALAASGVEGTHGARLTGALGTRQAKSEKTASELAPEWEKRLQELGISGSDLVQQARKGAKKQEIEDALPLHEQAFRVLHGPGGRPSWTRRDLMGALGAVLGDGASIAELEALADEILRDPELAICVYRPADESMGREARYASAQLFQDEKEIARLTREVTREGVSQRKVERILSHSTLDQEQAEAVRHLTGDGSLVRLFVAPPGSGKTYTLAQAAKVWRADGREVRALTNSWRASNELVDAGAVDRGEAAAYAYALCSPQGLRWFVPEGGVVVVDEASMMPTADLAAICALADQRHATVVMVGDPRQLGSVEAGGLFALLAEQLPRCELTRNRRQVEGWMASTIDDLRKGRSELAREKLSNEGRFRVYDAPQDAVSALLDDWLAERERGSQVAIFTVTHDARKALNRLAQEQLRKAGVLQGKAVHLAASTKREEIDEREIYAGDEIVFRKRRDFWPGQQRVHVANGTTGKVIEAWKDYLVVEVAGQRIKVSGDWASDWIDLAYAQTTHSAQGATIGTARATRERTGEGRRGVAYVLGPESMDLELITVASSRATDATRLFAWAETEPETHLYDAEGNPLVDPRDPEEAAERKWGTTGADVSALAEVERHHAVLSLAALPRDELEQKYEAVKNRLDKALAGETADDAVELKNEASILDEALFVRRQRDIDEALVDITIGESPWAELLGSWPPDRAGQLRYREALGALLDSEHWVKEARLASRSERIRDMAEHSAEDIVELIKRGGHDYRRLFELSDEEKREALHQQFVDALPAPPPALDPKSLDRNAVETFAAERLIAAASALDVSEDYVREVTSEAERLRAVVPEIPGKAALATAMRRGVAEEVLDHDVRGEDVPLAVRAVAVPGVTTPAVAAIAEAAEQLESLRAIQGVHEKVNEQPALGQTERPEPEREVEEMTKTKTRETPMAEAPPEPEDIVEAEPSPDWQPPDYEPELTPLEIMTEQWELDDEPDVWVPHVYDQHHEPAPELVFMRQAETEAKAELELVPEPTPEPTLQAEAEAEAERQREAERRREAGVVLKR